MIKNIEIGVRKRLYESILDAYGQTIFEYVLSWIYVNIVYGLDNNFVDKIKKLLDKHSETVNKCCIATIIGNSYGMNTGCFDLEEVVTVINNYNKSKFKKNRLKIHSRI